METDIQLVTQLIQDSPLDQTIKDILIRDLQKEGLNDFLREQILAYCVEGREKLSQEKQKALEILQNKNQQTPA